jgi:hypothetical protein
LLTAGSLPGQAFASLDRVTCSTTKGPGMRFSLKSFSPSSLKEV